MSERWLPVAGWEDLYAVSDLGRVRSLRTGKIMALSGDGRYLVVKLSRAGAYVTYRVHRLVGEAFLGALPPGQHTRHGPAGSLDNSLVNLSYGTPAENVADQQRDGTLRYGDDQPHARLTVRVVAECRRRCVAGETHEELAAEFGVSTQTMSKAIGGQTWRCVTDPPPVRMTIRERRSLRREWLTHCAIKLATPDP